MPLYKVKLDTRRWDEMLVEATDEEEAEELAKLNYDQCEKDPRIHWAECENESWFDGAEVSLYGTQEED